jgi:hypothetical protein
MQPETVVVEEYGMFDFCRKVQDLIQDGYEFDINSNENAPTSYGTYIRAVMVKRKDEIVLLVDKKDEKQLPLFDTPVVLSVTAPVPEITVPETTDGPNGVPIDTTQAEEPSPRVRRIKAMAQSKAE